MRSNKVDADKDRGFGEVMVELGGAGWGLVGMGYEYKACQQV